jgi:hypothetical protein
VEIGRRKSRIVEVAMAIGGGWMVVGDGGARVALGPLAVSHTAIVGCVGCVWSVEFWSREGYAASKREGMDCTREAVVVVKKCLSNSREEWFLGYSTTPSMTQLPARRLLR